MIILKMGNFVFNYNKKNDLHYQKTYTKSHIGLLNSFFTLQIVLENVFELLLFLKVNIGQKCRNKDWVLGQKRVLNSV